ncbi:formyltetrahydrofolate deformylase [Sphingomonas sp. CFBP8993]|uniref:formyltetrahydrofolate deformylase n=1 Tax=Sphingomonas sp. CFBP8993 TaxID=3096526 RepID=UPI002A69AC7B|nr:formyltetrahydrofolate deformylase [Sphingomonas sp. CFBP8993]MDY0958358.1 formyltetrahydrofolate deformylase [Sphingomonas sp. CFBP8993]
MSNDYILTLACQDRVGIVAAVSGVLAGIDGFILDSQQYADLETGRFFLRIVFTGQGARFPTSVEGVRAALAEPATRFGFDWHVAPAAERPRMLIAVSKGSHCLNDLLHRWRTNTLPVEIVGVVSNHDSLRPLVEWHGLPWHHLPVSDANRAEQEAAMLALMDETRADYLVLARYMQVLGKRLVAALPGRCINIHHSFLPGFKGAQPYHRAHARGVKLIGATAHFVTADLDEGPIIEQAVERVDHRASVDDLIRIGRDIEAQVLARAVAWVGERRVFLNDNRTVVFR